MFLGHYHILLTVDVEDWFQVENFKPWIAFSSWDSCELRVEKSTHQMLDLLDSIEMKHTEYSRQDTEGRSQEAEPTIQHTASNSPQSSGSEVSGSNTKSSENCISCPRKLKATFFVLGWLAERLPHLVREIQTRGHEVASHGYGHELCNQCSADSLKADLVKSRKLLEDIIGDRIYGYRAPSFSISDDVLTVIAEAGYLYDSSYNSFSLHSRYGKISTSGNKKKGIANLISKDFYELPISNLTLGKKTFPFGGGAYFRLLPPALFRFGVRRILEQQGAYLFYVHPWELDSGQPRVKEASANSKFRHYSNLGKTHQRLERLLKRFSGCRFITCANYLELG